MNKFLKYLLLLTILLGACKKDDPADEGTFTALTIFSINDPNAIGAMKKMREVGIKIPDDIAIIGFSNNPVCEIIVPNLTTIHQPAYEMGKISTELMFEFISGKKSSCNNKTIVLDTHLVVRDSC